MPHTLISRVVLVLSLLTPVSTYAFKIETHLWLADQIYSELRRTGADRRPLGLRIAGRYFQPNGELRAAIINNKGAFLMGVLGADLYPDMIAGQMTTHPGVNQRVNGRLSWQTDDWINHVIRSAEATQGTERPAALAFAAGYALHAAMDMWAHTYVNLYTGDVFSMTENTEAAERHVALESYLTNFHQSVLDLNPPSARSRADYLSNLRVPASFVRRTLILNPQAATQYERESTTFYLARINDHYQALGQLRNRVRTLNAQIAQELQRLPSLIEAYESALRARNDARTILDGHLKALTGTASAVGQSAANAAVSTLNALGLPQTASTVAAVGDQLDQTALELIDTLEEKAEDLQSALDAFGYAVSGTFDPAAMLSALQAAAGRLPEQLLIDWQRDVEQAMDAYVRAWEETGKEIMRPRAKRFTAGADPKGPILRWAQCWMPMLATPLGTPAMSTGCANVLSGVSNARAHFQAAKVALFALLPAGSEVMATLEAIDALAANQIASTLSQVADTLDAMFPATGTDGAGFANLAVRLWDKDIAETDLDGSFLSAGVSAGEDYVTGPLSRFVHRELQVCRGLPQPARRYSDFPFDDFAPIQNAVTMAKLTLLTSGGLNTVIRDLRQRALTVQTAPSKGAPKTAAGAQQSNSAAGAAQAAAAQLQTVPLQAYYTSPRILGAVLLGALRSIDGDHSWQAVAPPLPRASSTAVDAEDRLCRRFGYASVGYGTGNCADGSSAPTFSAGLARTGLLLFRPELRQPVFEALFDPVDSRVCEFAGQDQLDGLSCSKHTSDEFPPYVASATGNAAAGRSRLLAARQPEAGMRRQVTLAQPRAATDYLRGSFRTFDSAVTTPSLTNAYLLALLSYISYPGVPASSGRVGDAELRTQFRRWDGIEYRGWTSVQSRGKDSGSTQALAATTDDALIIAFRGSTIGKSDLGQDWWDNDLDFSPRPMPHWGDKVVLHDGFYDAAALTFPMVNDWINRYGENRKIIFTGHSLGGAIAFITAFEFKTRQSRSRAAGPEIGVYTFGAPPVGNGAWAQAYDRILPQTHRWSLDRDPVALLLTQLPGPFVHVGRRHNLGTSQGVRLNAPQEAVYPLQAGPTALARDLMTTHNNYWCRLRNELAGSTASSVPPPPRSSCELCSL